jgi:hypothetical protein
MKFAVSEAPGGMGLAGWLLAVAIFRVSPRIARDDCPFEPTTEESSQTNFAMRPLELRTSTDIQ